MTSEEAIKTIQQSFEDCKDGYWYSADKEDLNYLKDFASVAVNLAEVEDWEGALQWAKRCIMYEIKVGYTNCPIWGEFNECVQQVCEEMIKV